MNIKIVTSSSEKKHAFNIRTAVFVEEQKVPKDIEIDQFDDEAIHFIGYLKQLPIAASRLRWIKDSGKLERICVLKDYRGKAFGSKLIKEMERTILEQGYYQATLNAQTHAQSFYHGLGYETISEEFIDAGIPHVTMLKHLKK